MLHLQIESTAWARVLLQKLTIVIWIAMTKLMLILKLLVVLIHTNAPAGADSFRVCRSTCRTCRISM